MNRRIKQAFSLLIVAIIAVILVACDGNKPIIPTQYTVTFVAGTGATVTPTSVTVDEGEKITAPTATKEGHTLDGWYKEAAFTTKWVFATDTVTADISLYAKWTENTQVADKYTVTFDPNGGVLTSATSVEVDPGSLVPEPAISKEGYILDGWHTSANAPWEIAINTVSADVTLVAQWKPQGIAINSEQQLYDLAAGSTEVAAGQYYYLAADLDMTGFEWITTSESKEFPANFNGNGKKISNLTISGAGIGGLFQKVTGGKIFNLVIDNAKIESTGDRAGIIAGQLDVADGSVFDNITITNSSVIAKNDNGAGGLIGNVKWGVTISNITILNTTVYNHAKNSGGLIGNVNGGEAKSANTIITIKDIMLDVVVTSVGEDAGGVIGIATQLNPANKADYSIDGLVVRATVSSLRYSGGIVGKNANNDAEITENIAKGTIKNAIVMANVFNTGTNLNDVGYLAARQLPFIKVEHVYVVASMLGHAVPKGTNAPTAVLADVANITAAHLAGFNAAWATEAGNLPELGENAIDLGHKVTLNILEQTRVIYVNDGSKLPLIPTEVAGMRFDGWFNGDDEFVVATDVIEEDTVLTAHYTNVFTVSFDSDGGSTVTPKQVPSGSTLTLPNEPSKAGYNFVRWDLVNADDEVVSFDVESEITEDIKLIAIWVDDIAPTLDVSPVEGEISLIPTESFILIISINDANPEKVEISINNFDFEVLANADNPYGEAKNELNSAGITIAYNASTQTWTINLGDYTEDLFDIETTVTLVAHDTSENVSEELEIEYLISLNDVQFDVVFWAEGAIHATRQVYEGRTLSILPAKPIKEGHVLEGWYLDESFETPFVFATHKITEDTPVYAKFIEGVAPYEPDPEATAITTAAQLYDAASSTNGNYYLANDLDMTGFEWTATTTTFSGTFDGNFKTISNLTIVGNNTGYVGMFSAISNATVKNLIFNNPSITGGKSGAGLVAGNIPSGTGSTISNITVIGGSVVSDEYAASIVGRTQQATTYSNILINGTVITSKYAGGLTADANAAVTVADAWLKVVFTNSIERVGGLFGRARVAASTVSRVFVNITATGADKWVGGIVGDSGIGVAVTDVFVTGSVTTAKEGGHSIGGNGASNITLVRGFAYNFVANLTKPAGLDGTLVSTTPDHAWWTENLPSIATSNLWEFNETTSFFQLVR